MYAIEFGVADGEGGWPIRQVELQGPERVPTAAAALAEWPEDGPEAISERNAYTTRYGACGEQRLPHDWPVEDITADAFEAIWTAARAHMERHPRG